MEDKKIIDLYFERSENAIYETANKYGNYCRAIAFNILYNNEDTQECENDTYMAAWKAMPPTRPKILRVYLGRLTRNIALDKYDYNKAKKRNNEFDLILSELEECISSKENIETQFQSNNVSKVISDFLRTVNEEKRCIFLRRYWYSDSIEDISSRFNISSSKVKSTLFRMRKKLKLYLEKEGVNI